MAHLTYFALCEKYIYSDGKTTLINVYDIVSASSFPAVAKDFTIAFALHGVQESDITEGRINISIEIRTDKHPEDPITMNVDQEVTPELRNVTSGIDLDGKLQFVEEDTFTGKLFLNGIEMGTLVFEVKQVEQAQ